MGTPWRWRVKEELSRSIKNNCQASQAKGHKQEQGKMSPDANKHAGLILDRSWSQPETKEWTLAMSLWRGPSQDPRTQRGEQGLLRFVSYIHPHGYLVSGISWPRHCTVSWEGQHDGTGPCPQVTPFTQHKELDVLSIHLLLSISPLCHQNNEGLYSWPGLE